MVIAYLNVNSLLSHHDEIVFLVKEKGIHSLALNETKSMRTALVSYYIWRDISLKDLIVIGKETV